MHFAKNAAFSEEILQTFAKASFVDVPMHFYTNQKIPNFLINTTIARINRLKCFGMEVAIIFRWVEVQSSCILKMVFRKCIME